MRNIRSMSWWEFTVHNIVIRYIQKKYQNNEPDFVSKQPSSIDIKVAFLSLREINDLAFAS